MMLSMQKNYNRHIIYSIKLEKELYCYYFLMKSISQSNTRDITPHVSLTRLKFYFILNINKAKNRIGNMFKKSSIFSMDLYQTLTFVVFFYIIDIHYARMYPKYNHITYNVLLSLSYDASNKNKLKQRVRESWTSINYIPKTAMYINYRSKLQTKEVCFYVT